MTFCNNNNNNYSYPSYHYYQYYYCLIILTLFFFWGGGEGLELRVKRCVPPKNHFKKARYEALGSLQWIWAGEGVRGRGGEGA